MTKLGVSGDAFRAKALEWVERINDCCGHRARSGWCHECKMDLKCIHELGYRLNGELLPGRELIGRADVDNG